jgi:hypothetical protein
MTNVSGVTRRYIGRQRLRPARGRSSRSPLPSRPCTALECGCLRRGPAACNFSTACSIATFSAAGHDASRSASASGCQRTTYGGPGSLERTARSLGAAPLVLFFARPALSGDITETYQPARTVRGEPVDIGAAPSGSPDHMARPRRLRGVARSGIRFSPISGRVSQRRRGRCSSARRATRCLLHSVRSGTLAGLGALPARARRYVAAAASGLRRRVVGVPSAPSAARPWPLRAAAREDRRPRTWPRS